MVERAWANTVGGSFRTRSFRTWRTKGSNIFRAYRLQIGVLPCDTDLSAGEMGAPRMTIIILDTET